MLTLGVLVKKLLGCLPCLLLCPKPLDSIHHQVEVNHARWGALVTHSLLCCCLCSGVTIFSLEDN